jgi:uncharacterized protein (DUF433 family)
VSVALYRSVDLNEVPRYSVGEAARYLRMPESTLANWVAGRTYPAAGEEKFWPALVGRPEEGDSRLSFSNLIEIFVLGALRKQYRVKIPVIRNAMDYAENKLGVKRVLLSKELRATRDGNIFLQYLDSLIDVGRGGQRALPGILEAYLERIDWAETGAPLQVFPFTRPDYLNAPKLITINPSLAFGRPVIKRRAISTSAIAERFKAGESIRSIAEDYDLEASEVEDAIRYEALPLAA